MKDLSKTILEWNGGVTTHKNYTIVCCDDLNTYKVVWVTKHGKFMAKIHGSKWSYRLKKKNELRELIREAKNIYKQYVDPYTIYGPPI